MATISLGNNITIPAAPPDVFIPSINGVMVPPNLNTWAVSFDTSSCPSSQTCQFVIEWSLDNGTTWVQLVGNGGGSFTGGTWFDKKTGQTTGIKQIGPDPVQQNPYPTHFRIRIPNCTGMSPLNNVNLIIT